MPLTDVSISEVKALFDANVFGVMAMIVAFAPLLKANADDGRFSAIVNISSQADRVPFPFKGAYAASKAALSEYSRTLAVELDPFHVRVLTVITGYVASRLGRDATGVAHQPVLPAESLFTPMARDLIRPSRDGERMPADEFAERIVREVLKENGWRMWVTGWRFGGMRDWIRAGGKTTAVWLLTWLGERVAKYAMLRQWPFWKLNAAMQEEEARKKK